MSESNEDKNTHPQIKDNGPLGNIGETTRDEEQFGDTLYAFRFDWVVPHGVPYTLIVVEKLSGLCVAAVNENLSPPGHSAPNVIKFVESLEAINQNYFNGCYIRVKEIIYPELQPDFADSWNYIDGNFNKWHIETTAVNPDEFNEISRVKEFNNAVEQYCQGPRRTKTNLYKDWLNSLLGSISDPPMDLQTEAKDHPVLYAMEYAEYCIPLDDSWFVNIKNHQTSRFLSEFYRVKN